MSPQSKSQDTSYINDINETYTVLNNRHLLIYNFVMSYSDYIYSSRKYGEDTELTMIEVHTLSYIEDFPGVTPTDITEYWNKTKGYISNMITTLENKGLIEKRKKEGNAKNIHLYVTEKGLEVSRAHKIFDIKDIGKTQAKLLEKCTMEELDSFYKVLDIYNEVIKSDFDINYNR